MSSKSIEKKTGIYCWIVCAAVLVIATQLPILGLSIFDWQTTGENNIKRFFLGDQYWSWLVSQLDVSFLLACVLVSVFAFMKNRQRLFWTTVGLMVGYFFVGGFVLYVRSMGGLGGLFIR